MRDFRVLGVASTSAYAAFARARAADACSSALLMPVSSLYSPLAIAPFLAARHCSALTRSAPAAGATGPGCHCPGTNGVGGSTLSLTCAYLFAAQFPVFLAVWPVAFISLVASPVSKLSLITVKK